MIDNNLHAIWNQEREDDFLFCRLNQKDVNLVKIVCLNLMPVLYLIGTERSWFIGSVLNLAFEILHHRARNPDRLFTLDAIGVFGGIMWFLSSFYSSSILCWSNNRDHDETFMWGLFWIIGSFCNIILVLWDFSKSIHKNGRSRKKLSFQTISLYSTLVANIFCYIGANLSLTVHVGWVPTMKIGFFLFLIRSIFFALSVHYGHVVVMFILQSKKSISKEQDPSMMDDVQTPDIQMV